MQNAKVDFAIQALAVVKLFLLAFGIMALIVGIVTSTGPNCPAPVPGDWLGFCEAYEVN